MFSTIAISALALAACAGAQNTATSAKAVHSAAATALTSSPTSHVAGKAFDRFVVIMLENTDYDLASTDPNLSALAKQGITLSQYYAVTHPSEPNYVAAISGDNFGMDNDNFNLFPNNVSTVIDLLEDKGIAWGEYQQHQPYSGFEGYAYVNQQNGANSYVRKHNPAIIFGANNNKQRLSQIKNLTLFQEDLKNDKLPQWMFITPNMTNDGHDTSVTVAGEWTRSFLQPLLKNKKFMQNTLVLVTFDETETYGLKNNVFSFLLGDSIPQELVGTTDSNYYDHYSQIATVEANWGLHTLGRWDTGANVFSNVGAKTGDKARTWNAAQFAKQYFNGSYAGPFSAVNSSVQYPVPNTKAVVNGRTVLPSIVSTWGSKQNDAPYMIYNTGIQIPDGEHPPAGYAPSSDY